MHPLFWNSAQMPSDAWLLGGPGVSDVPHLGLRLVRELWTEMPGPGSQGACHDGFKLFTPVFIDKKLQSASPRVETSSNH